MGHDIDRNDDLALGLCTSPDHLYTGEACTRAQADELRSKLTDAEELLTTIHKLSEEAWHALTFRRPPVRAPADAYHDAQELTRLDELGREVRIILQAFKDNARERAERS